MAAASGCVGIARESGRAPPLGCAASQDGHAAGVGALPLHAQREGLDAAHGQVAFKRPEHRADGAREAAQRLVVLLVGDHHAAQHVAMAGQILGDAVHAEVRAQFQRARTAAAWRRCYPPPARRRPRARFRRCGRSAPRAAADSRWSPSGCSRAWLRRRPRASASRSQTSAKRTAQPDGLQHVHQQPDGGAVERVGRHDGFAPVGQRRQRGPCEPPPCPRRRPASRGRLRARTPTLPARRRWGCRSARSSSPARPGSKTRSSCSMDS